MIHLLAPRLRVEERLLMQAFAERACESALLDAAAMSMSLTGEPGALPIVVLDRNVATGERAVLGALLAASGSVVVNRTATMRMLADRLALVRHLVIAGVPVPETVVAFGEGPAIDAARQVGYPLRIMAPVVTPSLPDALAGDADSAEAILEHRATLAHETSVLLQSVPEGQCWRVVVVGDAIVAATGETADGPAPTGDVPDEIAAVVERVVSRLGTGVYAVHVVETNGGPVVTGASNLVEFRALQQAGYDIAGRIADFTITQIDGGASA